jgi:hypothetical protein
VLLCDAFLVAKEIKLSRWREIGWGRIAAALALLAICCRALLPTGYMFAASENGRFVTVTLCNAHGPAKSILDLETGAVVGAPADSGEPSRDTPQDSDAPCIYASAAPFAPPTTSIIVVFAPAAIENSTAMLREIAPGRGLAAPPPWSTGPPTVS